MAVVSIPDYAPWVISRRAFRQLLDRMLDQRLDDATRQVIEQAKAVDGLMLDLLTEPQRARLAPVVAQGADELRHRIDSGLADMPDPDGYLREVLSQLSLLLCPDLPH